MVMYTRLQNVENASQILKADKCGTPIANMAHTKPAITMQYGSLRAPSSLKSVYKAYAAKHIQLVSVC